MRELKMAMLGFGGIAKSHLKGHDTFKADGTPIKLVAICDIDPNQFVSAAEINIGAGTRPDLEGINLYTDLEEMMAKEEFELIDICLPTYLHKEYTIKMLKAGYNVMCEKPMALTSEDCAEMIKVAAECGKELMIGQCLRFHSQYLYLKELIDNKTFGKVRHVSMTRLSVLPRWGFEGWFIDEKRSGGCVLDLHVHDVDMVRFLFGEPEAVSAIAYDDESRWQYINTRFFYPGLTVVATGSWDEAPTLPFSAGFRVRFEKASVVLEGKKLMIYPEDKSIAPYEAEYEKKHEMGEEIRCIATCITDPDFQNVNNPASSAMKTVELVEAIRESIALDGEKVKFN